MAAPSSSNPKSHEECPVNNLSQSQIADRDKMRGSMDGCLQSANICWSMALFILLIVVGLNCLWLTPVPFPPNSLQAANIQAGIIVPSVLLLFLMGVLVGNGIAGSRQARRLGKRLAREFQDTAYYD